MAGSTETNRLWPRLPLEAWQDTCATLHMWCQIIGKIRLALAPMTNHYWQVPFYLTARGMTTSPMPYHGSSVQVDFDFLDHVLRILTDRGDGRTIRLEPKPVSRFYEETMTAFKELGITVSIWTTPVEVPVRIPFEQDDTHAAYDPEYANRLWRILLQANRVMDAFRSRFVGKASPVHFFWGAFDLAVTRFSGRRAPEHPGVPNCARYVMIESYSHEVSSCGFWPGFGLGEPAFYAYAYPEPDGFRDYRIEPEEAYYLPDMGEFILPYEAVRLADTPDEKLFAFLQTTYEAAADLAKWNRNALERPDE